MHLTIVKRTGSWGLCLGQEPPLIFVCNLGTKHGHATVNSEFPLADARSTDLRWDLRWCLLLRGWLSICALPLVGFNQCTVDILLSASPGHRSTEELLCSYTRGCRAMEADGVPGNGICASTRPSRRNTRTVVLCASALGSGDTPSGGKSWSAFSIQHAMHHTTLGLLSCQQP